MSSAKDMRQLFKILEKHGFKIELGKNNHYVITPPEDSLNLDSGIYHCSSTPQDWRTKRNVIAWARRAGLPRISH